MSTPMILGALWVVLSAITAMLPMRRQMLPGITLLLAAPVLLGWIAYVHGWLWLVLGLLAFVSLMGAALAAGNAVVMVPSMAQALIATDLYQVLDTSDVPGGVANIVTGDKSALGLDLAKHDSVDAIWYFGTTDGAGTVERASIGNLKQTWTETVVRDWSDPAIGGGRELMSRATQVKNIWIPYGE